VKHLVVASTNQGKVREIRAVLEGLDDWRVDSLPQDLPLAEETGSTFLENAAQKAEFYSKHLAGNDRWIVADDSGLIVDALDGRPGLFSSRYAPTDEARNQKLLRELEGMTGDQRTAQFVCALAFAKDGRTLWTTEGRIDGTIALEPIGDNGFGYDPLFLLPDRNQTTGQLPPETKLRISHRGIALAMLREYLEGSNF